MFICMYFSVLVILKTRLESGPVTADLTTTVIHSYKLLINKVQPFTHSFSVDKLTLNLYLTVKANKNMKIN